MADLPELNFTLNDEDGAPIVVAGDTVHGNVEALIADVPDLTAPDAAAELAQVVLHFARGRDYTVIDDPAGFEAAYRAQLDSEDPNLEWRQGSVRLVDFGVPDFTKITAPQHQDGTLVWSARDTFSGLPYTARAPLSDLGSVTIKPMSLTAVKGRVTYPEDPAIDNIIAPDIQADQQSETDDVDDSHLSKQADDQDAPPPPPPPKP